MPHAGTRLAPLAPLVIALALAACGAEEVVHGLSERDANEIIVLLGNHQPQIDAAKIPETGGRVITYKILVAPKHKLAAYELLNRNLLPRKRPQTYAEVFSQSGLIPTKSEEQAKRLSAIEGEIAAQLQLVPGVLEAEVNVVLPEDNPLRNPGEEKPRAAASVTLKYLPRTDGLPPIDELRIKDLIASSVEGLTPASVIVYSAPVTTAIATSAQPAGPGVCKDGKPPRAKRFGQVMCAETSNLINIVLVVAVLLVLALGFGLVLLGLRSAAIKSRLLRLQAELGNARKRKGGSGVVPAPSAAGLDVASGEKGSSAG